MITAIKSVIPSVRQLKMPVLVVLAVAFGGAHVRAGQKQEVQPDAVQDLMAAQRRVQKQLKDKEQELRDFRAENAHLLNDNENSRALRIQAIEGKLSVLKKREMEITVKLKVFEQAIKDKRSREELLAMIAADRIKDIRAEESLAKLERQEKDLQALTELKRQKERLLQEGFGSEHPKVKALTLELELLSTHLEELETLTRARARLELQEKQLIKELGVDHPKVQAARTEMERLSARLNELGPLGQLNRQKELLLADGYGLDHPKVKAIVRELETVRAGIKDFKMPTLEKDVPGKDPIGDYRSTLKRGLEMLKEKAVVLRALLENERERAKQELEAEMFVEKLIIDIEWHRALDDAFGRRLNELRKDSR